MSPNFKIEVFIPPQINSNGIPNIIYAADIGFKAFIYANYGLNLLLGASMNLLWGLINSLQISVRSPLMTLRFPSHCM
jgi:hypothetical protein